MIELEQYLLSLPFQKLPLTANRGPRNHFAINRARQQVKDDVILIAQSVKLPKLVGHAYITLCWFPRTVRRRDEDNMFPTMKPCLDGLVKYGLVRDDTPEFVTSACRIYPVDTSQLLDRFNLKVAIAPRGAL